MRDVETIEIAMEAAETGHLVLSTLHTIDAAKTVDRIVGVFPKTLNPFVFGYKSLLELGFLGLTLARGVEDVVGFSLAAEKRVDAHHGNARVGPDFEHIGAGLLDAAGAGHA